MRRRRPKDEASSCPPKAEINFLLMNHLLRSSQCLGSITARFPRAFLYSTETLRTTSSSNAGDSLRLWISQAGDPRSSIIPVLNQWLYQRKGVQISELQSIIKMLCHNRRFEQALEMSEWFTYKIVRFISSEDIATQLDLISKVHGLERAEKYFISIPETLNTAKVCRALLNCYAKNKCLEKAEATMQKMRELGCATSALSFNIILELAAQLGRHEKVDNIMQEMEEKGINCNAITFNTLLKVYGSTSDIEGIEKLLIKMAANPQVKVDSHAIVAAANECLRAGLNEQTLQMLKKAEQLFSEKTEKPYEKFISLYAACGRKNEVYRLWSMYKKIGKFNHSGYTSMISSLLRFDDFDDAEKIFEEWESGYAVYDARVPNLLISAYCKRGLLGKAELHINRLLKGGKEPSATMWSALASGYQRNGQMEESVAAMKKAILASTPQWKPNYLTLAACAEYLEGKKQKTRVEELLKLLIERGYNTMVNDIKINSFGENDLDQMGGDESFDGETRNHGFFMRISKLLSAGTHG